MRVLVQQDSKDDEEEARMEREGYSCESSLHRPIGLTHNAPLWSYISCRATLKYIWKCSTSIRMIWVKKSKALPWSCRYGINPLVLSSTESWWSCISYTVFLPSTLSFFLLPMLFQPVAHAWSWKPRTTRSRSPSHGSIITCAKWWFPQKYRTDIQYHAHLSCVLKLCRGKFWLEPTSRLKRSSVFTRTFCGSVFMFL